MHKSLCQSEAFDISWIEGSQCLFIVVRDGVQGFREVSKFFSALREARSTTGAQGWALDLRQACKIPDELWNWVEASWYPQLVGEGLRRQAIILPEAAGARAQWRGLAIDALTVETFPSAPRAVMWLGTDLNAVLPPRSPRVAPLARALR